MMITFNRFNSLRHAGALVCAAMLATAAFTACDKKDPSPAEPSLGGQTENVSEKPMLFQSSPMTKAAQSPSLPTGSSFGVFAFLQNGVLENGDWTYAGRWADLAEKNWTPAFMFNQKVTYSGQDGADATDYQDHAKYSYSPVKYWPYNEENTISFWAYYPYGEGGDADRLRWLNAADDNEYTNASTGLPRVQFTADGTTDLMTSDLMEDYVYSKNNGVVPFTFHHRLANVKILAKKEFSGMASGTDGYTPDTSGNELEGTVKITSIKVNGLAISGIYDPTADTDSWTVGTGTQTWSAVATGTTVTTDPTQVATYLHIPQTLSDDVTIEIAYTVTYNLPEGDEVTEFTKSFKLNSATTTEGGTETAGITAWEQNKQYSYTLTISQIEVMLQLQVDPITEVYYDSDHEDYLIKL